MVNSNWYTHCDVSKPSISITNQMLYEIPIYVRTVSRDLNTDPKEDVFIISTYKKHVNSLTFVFDLEIEKAKKESWIEHLFGNPVQFKNTIHLHTFITYTQIVPQDMYYIRSKMYQSFFYF